MLSEKILTTENTTVSLNELFPCNTTQFIKPFEHVVDPDIHRGICLDFELSGREQKQKISPILRLARPEDAEKLVGIYTELYNGTYPYKEMEDVEEVRKYIRDPNVQWLVYQDPSYNIAGCITFVLDFDNKRGYIRGFMLKKKYQGTIDITKAMIGSMLGMIHKFKNKIYTWYVENRTAHAKSQYSMCVCGISPIGFFPNKDVFLGKIESDLMQILYDSRALEKYRASEIPSILPQVEPCYLYSDERYNLGYYHIKDPGEFLNDIKIEKIKNTISKTIVKDKFGYETIKFTIEGTNSYFEFLYTPQVQNFEKTKYHIHNLEELYVFVQEFIKCKNELEVRYCEVFVSAYKPEHQKLFYEAGLSPRGYIPSWEFNNQKNVFEDNILFNWFEGDIDDGIQLIEEGKGLLSVLGLSNVVQYDLLPKQKGGVLQRFPSFRKAKARVENIWNFPKLIKSTLIIGLVVYLSLLFGSIGVASGSGYTIIRNTVSQLGSSNYTQVPLMFDLTSVFGGCITIIMYCYLSRRLKLPTGQEVKFLYRLTKLALPFGIVGSFGIMFVGVFSLDRSIGIVHSIVSVIAFSSFVIALFSYGILISRYCCEMPKIIGFVGIIPLLALMGNCIFPTPLLEWTLLFSILTSITPLVCWLTFR